MVNFYFADSNIIIGCCNPLDPFHNVAIDFFKEKDRHRTLLLFSIQEEFYRKLEYEKIDFLTKILGSYLLLSFPKIQRIIRKPHLQSIILKSNFIRYIFYLFEKHKITEISYTSIIDIFEEYKQVLRSSFNNLIKNWIKKPHMDQHDIIYKDSIYLMYYNKLLSLVHRLDASHLALACFEVRRRNRKNRYHVYYFYTNDKEWIAKNLESHIKIKNFHIKLIPYRKTQQKVYNPITKSFNLDKFEYIPDGL